MKKNNKESVVEKDAEIVKDSEQEETSRAIIAQKREIRYSGPIPDPDTFRRYEEVLPGAADRILIMAEKEQNSRHKINDKIVEEITFNSRLGIIMAAIIAFVCVVAGVFICIFSEASIVGGVVSFGGVATIVAVFLKYTSITMELGNSEKKEVSG